MIVKEKTQAIKIEKWIKDLNGHFSKDLQITCPQAYEKMLCITNHQGIANQNQWNITSYQESGSYQSTDDKCWQGRGEVWTPCISGGNVRWSSHWERWSDSLSKSCQMAVWPSNFTSVCILKIGSPTDIGVPMFIALSQTPKCRGSPSAIDRGVAKHSVACVSNGMFSFKRKDLSTCCVKRRQVKQAGHQGIKTGDFTDSRSVDW